MKSNTLVLILLAAAAAFALVLATKSLRPQVAPNWRAAQNGVVRDAATGQPIAGAWVIVRWLEQRSDAFGGGLRSGRCLDRAVVRSDADGRFAFAARSGDAALDPAWHLAQRGEYLRDVHVYATGYRAERGDARDAASQVTAEAQRNGAADTDADASFALHTDQAPVAQRLAGLLQSAGDLACDGQAASPVAAVLENDANALACAGGADSTAMARLHAALGERLRPSPACATPPAISTASR